MPMPMIKDALTGRGHGQPIPDKVEEGWAAIEYKLGLYATTIRLHGWTKGLAGEIMAAVRDAMLAVHDDACPPRPYNQGPCKKRTRIQALGNPQGGQGSGESDVAGPDGGKEEKG